MSSQPSDTTRTKLSVLKRWVRRGKLTGRLANGVIRLSLWRQRCLTSRYDRWVARHDTLSADDIKDIRDRIARLPARPSISVIVPTADTAGTDLAATVASVRAQLWPDWDLYLCGAAPSDTSDQRIHCVAPDAALASARGTWIIVLHPGDRLAPAALSEFGLAAIANPAAAIIYADEDRIDSAGRRFDPYFKSDFDPDLLRAQNLAGRACVWRAELLRGSGCFRPDLDDQSMHELAIRCAGSTAMPHIPRVLYHRRDSHAGIDPNPMHWPLPDPLPLVSIIVPTRDKADLLRPCIDGLLNRTDYAPMEVLIADNGSIEPETAALFRQWQDDPRVRVLPLPGPFNYASINNQAVAEAAGEIIVLLNNDTEIIAPGWLQEMVSHAVRPGVGAVGAKLLYANGTIQHAGVVLGISWRGGGVAGHIYSGEPGDAAGPFGLLSVVRSVSAVTAACLAVRRDRFLAVGGLDEENLAVDFNDVDLCLRLRAAGYRNVWTPFAVLYHKESASRGKHITAEQADRLQAETAFMRRRWSRDLDRDPYWNLNLSLSGLKRELAYRPRSRA